MATRIVVPTVAPWPAKVVAVPIGDAAETTLVTVLHLGVPTPYVETYLMTRAGAFQSIGRSEPIGKDDSGAAVAYRDGTVRLVASEADPIAGSPGSSSDLTYYDFPGAAPLPAGGASATDATARAQIAVLDARLDKLSAALTAAGLAVQG